MRSYLPNPHLKNIKRLGYMFASSDKSGFDAQAVVAHPLHDDPVLDHELKGMLIKCAQAAQASLSAAARINKERANPTGWMETFDEEDGLEHVEVSPASFGSFGDVQLDMHETILEMVAEFLSSAERLIVHSAQPPAPGEFGYDAHSGRWWNDAKELGKQLDALEKRRQALGELRTTAYSMERLHPERAAISRADELPAPAQQPQPPDERGPAL